jgi:hypothetical protein
MFYDDFGRKIERTELSVSPHRQWKPLGAEVCLLRIPGGALRAHLLWFWTSSSPLHVKRGVSYGANCIIYDPSNSERKLGRILLDPEWLDM